MNNTRKWDVYKNMNRNSTYENHLHLNEERADTPSNIIMGQIWLEENTAQVEITELNSDDSGAERYEEKDNIWNYLDKDRFSLPAPEFYHANRKAREKRRNHNADMFSRLEDFPEQLEEETSGIQSDVMFTSFYDFTNDLVSEKVNTNRNHQSNCFTIINKPFNTSESSSDDIELLNTPEDLNNNETPYDSEILTFQDDNKRTIWIYSFKNKRILSENDFELVNIPSQDSESSTSCSDNFIEEADNPANVSRISSPIPAAYVPRLNLSMAPTLPTVTEITEPINNENTETSKADANSMTHQKTVNNWLSREVIDIPKERKNNQDKASSMNVLNWMCLSPRERRRRFKHTNASPTHQPILPVLPEVPTSEPKSRSSLTEIVPNKVLTTAEINTTESEAVTEQPPTTKRSIFTCRKRHNETNKDKITLEDVDDNEMKNETEDVNLLKMPKIIIFKNDHANYTKISDPIEKLNSNIWINDDSKKEVAIIEQDLKETDMLRNVANTVEECAGKKLWARNMTLLKPTDWAQFMPITDSIPSLHLSIDSDSRKKTWLSRLLRCFRCFK